MLVKMTFNTWLSRVYYLFRYTSAYTGRFIFLMIRVGMWKCLLLFILVRVYHISLTSFCALARDLATKSTIGLGRYLYRGQHSYEEIKEAVCTSKQSVSKS